MVKDRQVLDGSGRYSIYSRSAEQRRKQHSGSAVIALALETFKRAVLLAAERGEHERLRAWRELLGLEDPDRLLAVAAKPTLIVPANITFYPIRVRGNPLARGAELFNKGISPRLREELMVEGNILLKDTDMDIRLGEPIRAANFWSARERRLVEERAGRLGSLEDAFTTQAHRVDQRLRAAARRLQAERLRDAYMHAMYQLVTVNLSHLAALTIYRLLDDGQVEVDAERLHRTLYLAVKQLQSRGNAHLHRSLCDPASYEDLPHIHGYNQEQQQIRCPGLTQFLRTATLLQLIERQTDRYRFSDKLRLEHDFDEIRLENPIEVYANEVAPIRPALAAVTTAIEEAPTISDRRLAELRFDDELLSYAWDKQKFERSQYAAINSLQTQIEDARPFLFQPPRSRQRPLGVLLVHGFLSTPAEVREFGEQLSRQHYTVLGVRLKGHGTSPWDLRSRSRHDWIASVRRGYEILAPLVDRVALVGFSTGASLALTLAAEHNASSKLAGLALVATPMRFKNKNMLLVPLVHGTNRLVEMVRADGVLPFRPNDSEHPHINYVHMPVRALYELGRLVDEVKKQLAEVTCPALIVQGDGDPVVEPDSAKLLYEALSNSVRRQVLMIPSERHGILYEDIGETRPAISRFFRRFIANDRR